MRHLLLVLMACLFSPLANAETPDPRDLIKQAMDHWRRQQRINVITRSG